MGAVGEVGRMHGGSCLVKQASQSRERPRARGQARRRCQVSAGVRVPVHPSFLPSFLGLLRRAANPLGPCSCHPRSLMVTCLTEPRLLVRQSLDTLQPKIPTTQLDTLPPLPSFMSCPWSHTRPLPDQFAAVIALHRMAGLCPESDGSLAG